MTELFALNEGVHDLDDATYHADPCAVPSLSASIAKLLIDRSPWHAWYAHPRLNPRHEPAEDAKFDLGSAVHKLLLGKGAEIEEIDAEDFRTKAAKEARALAREAGRIPMLAAQLARAESMVAIVQRQIAVHEEAAEAFAGGAPERSIVWREDNGIWCRARLDWMPHNGLAYPDLKTTGAAASPDQWGRRVMFDTGCDIQDAFYRRGLKKLGISTSAYLLFVVAEVDEPHAMATHRCSPGAAAIADRKVEHAVNLWKLCTERNRWPGYRKETAWHDPPPWHEQRWIDREDSGAVDNSINELMVEGALTVDRPAHRIGDDRVDAFGLLPIGEGDRCPD